MSHEWHRDGFTISTDPARLDLDAIHAFLSSSYWARHIPRAVVARSVVALSPAGGWEAGTRAEKRLRALFVRAKLL